MIPTDVQLTRAHEYALSKLCTEIPDKYAGVNHTIWDERAKECRITERGCMASITNPISQPMYTSGGEYRQFRTDNRTFGSFWERSPPGYYIWKATSKSGGRRVCGRGNFLLWQWCEQPQSRAEGHKPGITDTEKFNYNIRNGKEECLIPKSYCDSKGVSFNASEGDCYVKDSQRILEFFAGSVITRKNRASDKRLKDNIIPVRKDFPYKGVHLYTFKWNSIATTFYGLSGDDIGFIADELDPKYIVTDDLGYKNINMDIDDAYMNKLVLILNIKNHIKNRVLH